MRCYLSFEEQVVDLLEKILDRLERSAPMKIKPEWVEEAVNNWALMAGVEFDEAMERYLASLFESITHDLNLRLKELPPEPT